MVYDSSLFAAGLLRRRRTILPSVDKPIRTLCVNIHTQRPQIALTPRVHCTLKCVLLPVMYYYGAYTRRYKHMLHIINTSARRSDGAQWRYGGHHHREEAQRWVWSLWSLIALLCVVLYNILTDARLAVRLRDSVWVERPTTGFAGAPCAKRRQALRHLLN